MKCAAFSSYTSHDKFKVSVAVLLTFSKKFGAYDVAKYVRDRKRKEIDKWIGTFQ